MDKLDNVSMKTPYPMPKAPMNTARGKDPGVKRLAKYPIKGGFFTKKPGMKGDC